MNSNKLCAFILLIGMLLTLACRKEYSCEACLEKNKPPIANAGKDTALLLPANSITLDGTGSSDPEGAALSFLWTSISAPGSYAINDSTAAITVANDLLRGTYQFELMVTDTGGLAARDTITIKVDSVPTTANVCELPKTLIGSLSISREYLDIFTAGKKLVFAAGSTDNAPIAFPSSRVDIYDLVNETWSTADLSIARLAMGSIAMGNKIYFAGGIKDYIPISRVDIYDASDNTWSIAELSAPRYQVVAGAAGNKVVFAGGIANSVASNIADIYDQSTGTWSAVLLSDQTNSFYSMKSYMERSGVITVGNKIYFKLDNHTVDVYDAQANTWATLTGYPNQLWDKSVVSLGNSIFFPSMYNGRGFSNALDVYNVTGNNWTSINMQQSRSEMVAATADNKIFWAGGYDSCCMLKDIEIYDLSTRTHSLHQLQHAAGWLDVLKTDTKLIFSYLEVSDIYDIPTQTWTTCNTSFAKSIAIGNTVYLVGPDNAQVWKIELD